MQKRGKINPFIFIVILLFLIISTSFASASLMEDFTNFLRNILGVEISDDSGLQGELHQSAILEGSQYQDLVAYWKFENNAKDETGKYNGTLYGNTVYVAGKKGNAIRLDGDNDYMQSTFGYTLNPSLTPLTYSLWVRCSASGGNANPIFLSQSSAGTDQRMFLAIQSGKWAMGIQGSSSSSYSNTAADNNWHMITVVMDKTNAKMYVDGIDIGYSKPYTSYSFNSYLRLGVYSSSLEYDFAGDIDEAMVYQRALNITEIQQLYCSQGGTGTFCSTASCTDGIKNQDETDIDCGGTKCSKCSNGKACVINSDCSSNQCTGGKCVVACTNDAGCSSSGSFCQGAMPYTCSLGTDGCFDRINKTACGSGYTCSNGNCITQNTTQKCASTDTSCGAYPNCLNCNNNDGCSVGAYRDYRCSNNTCVYVIITKDESLSNNNCNDLLDNDCDGKTDMQDSGCSGVTPPNSFPKDYAAYYKFENNAKDETGKYNGTLYGNTVYVAGKKGNAIRLDGDNDYMQSTFGYTLNPSLTPLTYSLWVRCSASGGNANPIFLSQSSAGTDQRMFLAIQSGKWAMGIQGSSSSSYSNTAADNNWHMITVVMDKTNAKMYVDGIDIGYSKPYTSYSFNSYLRLGVYSSSLEYDFAGDIDEAMVYQRALNITEIQQLYCSQGGTGTFCSTASCTDGIKNQDETDIDCGGTKCSKCSNGKACVINSDCSSNQCTGGKCMAPCITNSDCSILNDVCAYGVCDASSKCQQLFNSSQVICRYAAGECDLAETCTGSSAGCSLNVFKSAGTPCSIGKCDGNGTCSQKCSDGTNYGSCSLNKPSYCSDGISVNNCSFCGCPNSYTCQFDGGCKILTKGNIKDMTKYSNRGVFLLSDKNWREVLPWVSVAVWSGNEICKKGTETPNNICVYPFLIYHEESGTFDADSIVYFMQQYNSENITLIGNSPQDLDNLLVSAKPFGAGMKIDQIRRVNEQNYLNYWQNYDSIVLTEDKYELALLASTYASLINAPLVINGTSLNNLYAFSGRKVICVGDVLPEGDSCDETYNLDSLQKKYVAATGTTKIIFVNPKDISRSIAGTFTPSKSPKAITDLFTKTSLAAPVLASAKKEIILMVDETNTDSANSKIKQELSRFYDIPALIKTRPFLNEFYLTIISDGISMPYKNKSTTSSQANDQFYYSSYDSGNIRNPSMSIGRIFGISISDVSSLISRTLFYNDIKKPDNASFMASLVVGINGSDYVNISVSAWVAKFKEVRSFVSYGFSPTRDYSLNDPNRWVGYDFISYNDHGNSNWAGIYSNKIPLLNNPIVFSYACSTCSTQNKDSFCANAIRQGAIAFIGAVDLGYDGNPVFKDTFNNVYYNGMSVGEGFNRAYKGYPVRWMMTLIGDPTLKFGPKLKTKIADEETW